MSDRAKQGRSRSSMTVIAYYGMLVAWMCLSNSCHLVASFSSPHHHHQLHQHRHQPTMATITNGGGGGGGRRSRVGHTCTYMAFADNEDEDNTARTISQSTPTTTATASIAGTNNDGTTPAKNPKASSGDDFSFFDEASIYGAFVSFVSFCLFICSDE
jgi:hypothetical protein